MSVSRLTDTMWPKAPTLNHLIGLSGMTSLQSKVCPVSTINHAVRLSSLTPGSQANQDTPTRHDIQEFSDYVPEAEVKG